MTAKDQDGRDPSRVVANITDTRDPSRVVATITAHFDGCTLAITETIDRDFANVNLCQRGAITLAQALDSQVLQRVDIAAGASVVTVSHRWGRVFVAIHGKVTVHPEIEIGKDQAEQLGRQIRRGLGLRILKPADPRELADLVADGWGSGDSGFLDSFFGRLNRRLNVWHYITETVKGEWKPD